MPSTIVNDFRLGVDRRRKRISGPPGSLWTCINAHLTRGGDIEKRKKMVAVYENLPGVTFGFRKTANTAYVFGSDAPGTVTVPAGVTYQRLRSPSPLHPDMTALKDITLFDGKVYAVAEYSDGNIHHFYDGEWVSAWDDGVVRSYNTALSEIAARIAALINANGAEVATASAVGNVITITGKAVNVSFTVSADAINGGSVDDQTATVAETQAATAGLPEISTVTLAGTLEAGDRFSVTINSNNYGAGDNPATVATRLFTHGSKIYAMVGPTVYYCAVDDPTEWRSNVNGAGFENLSNNEEGSLSIVGASRYQGDVAFFANDTAQIWTLDSDPANNAMSRVLENSGSIAGRSMIPFGNSDILYLSRSGSRSVRSRDVSGAPFVSDIGNAIDALLIEDMRTLGADDVALATAMLEPVDGRYMLALGDKIYVLSYFPGSKITGWSWYEIDEVDDFSVDWSCTQGGKLYVRSGNTVYVYGGTDGDSYDSSADDNYVVTVGLPFMGGKLLFEGKRLTGWDMAVENEWLVEALVDPRNENRKVTVGTVSEITYPDLDYPAQIDAEMYALQMTCSQPGAASISNFTMHFE
jgi:hypothetical protein